MEELSFLFGILTLFFLLLDVFGSAIKGGASAGRVRLWLLSLLVIILLTTIHGN